MGASADHAATSLDAPAAEAAQAVSSRPRDAASAQHPANDGDDAEADDPDAAQGASTQPQRAWRANADARPAWQQGARAEAEAEHEAEPEASPGAGTVEHSAPGMPAPAVPAPNVPAPANAPDSEHSDVSGASAAEPHGDAPSGAACNWAAFCDFCASWQDAGRDMPRQHLLRSVGATWNKGVLRLAPKSETQMFQLERAREALMAALVAYGAGQTRLELVAPRPYRPEAELIDEFSQRPELRPCLEVLNARLKGCRPVDQDNR